MIYEVNRLERTRYFRPVTILLEGQDPDLPRLETIIGREFVGLEGEQSVEDFVQHHLVELF